MNRQQLQEQLDAVRERLLVTVDPLPDSALLAPGTIGDWSVRDVLVHLTLWEAELVTALMQIKNKRRPDRLLNAAANRDQYNARRYAENVDRDLDIIFDDLFGVRRQLERWLERFPDRDFIKPKRFPWLREKTLGDFIARYTIEHEAAHLDALEAFAEAWLVDHPDDAAGADETPLIGLDDIEVKGNGSNS